MMLYHLGLDAERGPSGKRLRPVLCTLVHEALTGDARAALPAASAIELLHNFTLIHDDIEDQDPARHHRPTVWSVWGVPQAINAGDGMFAVSRLAVQRLRGFPAERVLEFAKLVDEGCVRVCEGQFLDISFETRTDVTTERYRAMAAKKTGALFAAAAQGAALLATDDVAVRETLARFGDAFGQAFQAHDDVLGIWATTERTGKVEMNDLTKRKKTLPVVLGFERAQGKTRERLFALAVFVLLTLWLVIQWIPWSARWYVLTDRRVITKRGVLNRTQAALLLDRVQDASISHPFPLSMIRDYGVLHLESAGEHAQERLEGGTHELAMTGSTK